MILYDTLQYLGTMSMVGQILLLTVTTFVLYYIWFNNTRAAKLVSGIPGPAALPVFGSALLALLARSPREVMRLTLSYVDYYMQENMIGKVWLGNKLIVGLASPADIEVILGSNVHLEKSEEYKFFQPWLGDGLLISKGERWRTHRKMIAPTFHKAILKSFVPVFHKKSMGIVERLRKTTGQELDIHDYMSTLTVNILLETAMGANFSTDDKQGYDYAKAVMDMCLILHERHVKFWLRPDFLFKWTKKAKEQEKLLDTIHSLTKKVLKSKQKEYAMKSKEGSGLNTYADIVEKTQTGGGSSNYKMGAEAIKDDLDIIDENDVGEKKRMAFLDYMVEASHTDGAKLTDQDIQEEVDTIMFEGHDTTAAASSFCLAILGVHKNIQERVMEELNEIFQGSDRPVTFEDTLEMKYLERVIMETLRLYPPVPVISRKVNEEVKLPSGYTLPVNTTVVIGIVVLHRSTQIYDNPLKFDPDNFLPEKCQNRNYYGFIPFSAGPRGCVGRKYAMLKLKVVLANILRNFKITSPVKEEDFQLQADIILKRSDGFQIVLEERAK